MEQYIKKSAVLAEIERLKSIEKNRYSYITTENAWIGARNFTVNSLISFIDTLEVKEMDSTDAFIEKACKWIEEFNNHNHIMRYSDSCEPPFSELTEWFKNYMKEENINSK